MPSRFRARSSRSGSPSIASGSSPSRTFVPRVIVIGRSVFSRRVKHGIPRYVVSSCTPPESVITAAALASSARKSR